MSALGRVFHALLVEKKETVALTPAEQEAFAREVQDTVGPELERIRLLYPPRNVGDYSQYTIGLQADLQELRSHLRDGFRDEGYKQKAQQILDRMESRQNAIRVWLAQKRREQR